MRIAVISPLVVRRQGTKRAVAELIERLPARYGDEVDLYAQRVSDVVNVRRAGETGSAGAKFSGIRSGKFLGRCCSDFAGACG